MPKQKFWQTQRFKDLQKKWEERLKNSGFIDHERNGKLTQNAANSYRTQSLAVIENKQRYYELIGQRCHDEDFSDPVEKYVMSRRAEGIGTKQIGQELKDINQKNSIETIRKIIRFYEKKWGVWKRHKTRWDMKKKKTP